MKRAAKEIIVQHLSSDLKQSKFVWLTDFKGLNVETMGSLRKRIRDNSLKYRVVKNTLFHFALEKSDLSSLGEYADGSIGICLGDDPILAARTLVEFQRETGLLKLKGGWLDGRLFSALEIQQLATLPNRDILLAMFLGALAAPLSNFTYLLKSVLGGLVQVLKEINKKKGENNGKSKS